MDSLHIRRRKKSSRNGEEAPKGSISSSSPGACPAELTHVASEATAGAATTMIFGVDEKQSDDDPNCLHYLHKMEKGEARGCMHSLFFCAEIQPKHLVFYYPGFLPGF
jgi:hypothetical protein